MISDVHKAELYSFLQFKTLEPRIAAVDAFPDTTTLLPILDTDARTICRPTYLNHHKFSISESKAKTLNMISVSLIYLECIGTDPVEMFAGVIDQQKVGFYAFDNPYKTALRIWSTKKVGSRVVFEVSVAGYKDAVPEPMPTGQKAD